MDKFAELVYSGELVLGFPIAMLAGLVAFISPCVLPLIPGYLGFISGLVGGKKNLAKLLGGTALFILGFSVVFISYGAAFGALGHWFIQWREWLTIFSGVVLIVMGFVFTGWIPFLQGSAKLRIKPTAGLFAAPLLGFGFGLGWTPCIGPVLTAIVALSAQTGSPIKGAILGLAFCLGLGIPFLLMALGFNWVTKVLKFVKENIRLLNIIGGLLLILIGLLMVSGIWSYLMNEFQAVIANFVPAI